jgi:hypothetical protein
MFSSVQMGPNSVSNHRPTEPPVQNPIPVLRSLPYNTNARPAPNSRSHRLSQPNSMTTPHIYETRRRRARCMVERQGHRWVEVLYPFPTLSWMVYWQGRRSVRREEGCGDADPQPFTLRFTSSSAPATTTLVPLQSDLSPSHPTR